MILHCPVCGERDAHEFSYGGDATVTRPALDDSDVAAWNAYVYDRTNPRGAHREYWHHVQGCRAWLVVDRDTLTHRISGVHLAGPWGSGTEG